MFKFQGKQFGREPKYFHTAFSSVCIECWQRCSRCRVVFAKFIHGNLVNRKISFHFILATTKCQFLIEICTDCLAQGKPVSSQKQQWNGKLSFLYFFRYKIYIVAVPECRWSNTAIVSQSADKLTTPWDHNLNGSIFVIHLRQFLANCKPGRHKTDAPFLL